MKVKLINVDSKIPNLALMQYSGYLKSSGHEVGWNISDPDLVLISCVFTKNAAQARGIARFWPRAKIEIGGSGIDLEKWLPFHAQKWWADYDLYPDMDYSMGFTTRGCIRKCKFCIVPEKEGKLSHWMHPAHFHDPRHKKIMLLDNNWYSDPEWFYEMSGWILRNDIAVNPIQGCDIRLLTDEIAHQLSQLKIWGVLHFAWDNIDDEERIKNGIKILKKHRFDIRQKVEFYVLVGFNSTPEQDLYRVNRLKELGTHAFVMRYKDTPFTKAISRWANRWPIYWTTRFEDYKSRGWTPDKLKELLGEDYESITAELHC